MYGDQPLFCSLLKSNAAIGACYQTEDECRHFRDFNPDTRDTKTECSPRTAAACFNATRVLDGKRLLFCQASVKDCESLRSERLNDPDFTALTTRCGIYRMRGAGDEK